MENYNFNKEFYKLLNNYPQANELINCLNDCGEVLLFGGAVREFNDSRFNNTPRDFDIVIKKSDKDIDLDNLLNKFYYKKNRFNGYKIKADSLEFDIWEIENTWAFKEKKVNCSEDEYIEKLQETVFLNIDSVIYNITKQQLHNNRYEEAMKYKVLDVVLIDNPYVELNILRAILFKKKYNMKFSNRLIKLLDAFMDKNDNYLDKIYESQFNHYHSCKIRKRELESELYNIRNYYSQ